MAQHIITSDGIRKGGFNAAGEYDRELPEPRFDTEVRIDSGRGYSRRFGIGLVRAGTMARKVTNGPLVEGPWAYAYGRATVLSATPMPEDPHVDAEWGDTIVLDGIPFIIQPAVVHGRVNRDYADLDGPVAQ